MSAIFKPATAVAAIFALVLGAGLPARGWCQPSGAAATAPDADVTVTVSGIRNPQGEIIVWLWSGPDGFAKDDNKAFRVASIAAGGAVEGKVSVHWAVPAGDYAVTTLHDENGNRRLDMSFLGIPTEGFGVSNNVMAMGPPAFKDTKVPVPSTGAVIPLKLRYF